MKKSITRPTILFLSFMFFAQAFVTQTMADPNDRTILKNIAKALNRDSLPFIDQILAKYFFKCLKSHPQLTIEGFPAALKLCDQHLQEIVRTYDDSPLGEEDSMQFSIRKIEGEIEIYDRLMIVLDRFFQFQFPIRTDQEKAADEFECYIKDKVARLRVELHKLQWPIIE